MYKIIQKDKIIDVVDYPKFVRFLASGHIALTDSSSAQGIVGSDNKTIYTFTPIKDKMYDTVSIIKISSEEFKRLKSLLNSDVIITADESALTKAKSAKINKLSKLCKSKIIAGFNIELSDGETVNFKLTTEDQLNLMMIENQLSTNENFFIYHSTNSLCRLYTREDMCRIIKAFKAHVIYHTTYFNIAKHYIKSLTDIEKVNLFTYGTDVSEATDNPVLKQIIKNGGICR